MFKEEGTKSTDEQLQETLWPIRGALSESKSWNLKNMNMNNDLNEAANLAYSGGQFDAAIAFAKKSSRFDKKNPELPTFIVTCSPKSPHL